MPAAASFSVRGDSPARAARALTEALGSVKRPSGALLFASGGFTQRLETLAEAIAKTEPGVPVLIAAGAGVLTDRGEIENESAVAGLAWTGGQCTALTANSPRAEDLYSVLARSIEEQPSGAGTRTALVFARPDGVAPHALEPLQSLRKTCVFGAGTVGNADVFAVSPSGALSRASSGALLLNGIQPPHVRSSPACRLLMPLRRITEASGSMILSVEGEGALEVLSAVAADLVNQPLVFVVLSNGESEEGKRPELLLRAVQGVDPSRHGLMVAEEVHPGMRMAFAVRDASAARLDLEAVSRDIARDAAGAAPRFGIYLNCAGRGSALYQAPDVDSRILRSRFGDVPFIGMQSSFEVAPYCGKPSLQLYTGVVALFTSPS